MYARYISIALLALPLLASAAVLPRGNIQNSCNNGAVQCCNSVQDASTHEVQRQLAGLGVALGSITGLVGLTCNPISVIGAGSNTCTSQSVCCTNNSFGGIIAAGCNPIAANVL